MKIRQHLWASKTRHALVVLAAFSILLSPPHSKAEARQASSLLRQLSSSLEEVVRNVSPAVVQITVTGYGQVDKEGRSNTALVVRQRVTGSGVIIDPDGYIITNAHVVSGAQKIQVLLSSQQANGAPASIMNTTTRSLSAQIVGVDRQIDLALLKADAKGLPALSFADYAQIRQGQFVLAFGSPEGLENSVTTGVISSVARQTMPNHPFFYIQTDAPINPGNSGGPLVDVEGKVVGLNTFIITQGGGSEGLGFAIPSSVVNHVYQQLREFGHVHRKVVGATVQQITAGMASALNLSCDHGMIVADVFPKGPAESAGLKIQDIVLSVDGKPIASVPEFESFLFLHDSGDKMKMEVLRKKEEITIEIPVKERREEEDQLNDLVNKNNLIPQLGILGVTIDERIARMIDDLRVNSGVLIAALTESVDAQEIGFAAGDVIHSVNGVEIDSVEAFRKALGSVKPGSTVALQVERDGQLQFVEFEMD
ncbi:MAG: trypsin-like peptidase domain-containing protein [Acidobacteriota bacterium]